jgi:hypothetical protein
VPVICLVPAGEMRPDGTDAAGARRGIMADVVKLDLWKQLKALYLPSAKEVVVVDVPEMQYAMIDGQMEPGKMPGDSPGFASAIGALFGISYTLKFVSKKRPVDPIDYTVMALEGLWTTPEGGADYATSDQWQWTLMIMQPDHITQEMFADALGHLRGRRDPAMLDRLRLERFAEGLCIQTMHVGPYLDEPRTFEKMRVFAETHGYVIHGRHHEIYLGDPRTAKPENLRTVLRHQVTTASRT